MIPTLFSATDVDGAAEIGWAIGKLVEGISRCESPFSEKHVVEDESILETMLIDKLRKRRE